MIQARVECDSIGENGERLTTIVGTLPRFMLPELNTHRVFSRNSASSRAIPMSKTIARVQTDPAVPVEFGANQPGMQAGEEDEVVAKSAREVWLAARDSAVEHAQMMEHMGIHKQVTNRILEPFMWHEVVITATEWDGFFDQRVSELAQPEIRVFAEAVKEAMDASEPEEIGVDGWHLPFIQPDEKNLTHKVRVAASVARCARVSYLNHDGVRDVEKDIDLFIKLVTAQPPHASPLEHIAMWTPATAPESAYRNFTRGWIQFRAMIEDGMLPIEELVDALKADS
jgi:hypothetical protein